MWEKQTPSYAQNFTTRELAVRLVASGADSGIEKVADKLSSLPIGHTITTPYAQYVRKQ